MRQIQFRAWDGGKMIYQPSDDSSVHSIWKLVVAIPSDSILMQYTGLKDKNGKEIYEGDIVYLAGIGNCLVKFMYCSFVFENGSNIIFFNEIEWVDIGSVLGNIYENPELLIENPPTKK